MVMVVVVVVVGGCATFRRTRVCLPHAGWWVGVSVLRAGRCPSLQRLTVSTAAGCPVARCAQAIDQFAFNSCPLLTRIDLPGTLATVGELAFAGCTSLSHLALPASVSAVGHGAFAGCTSLATVTMETGTVEFREAWASGPCDTFAGCTALAKVSVPGGTPGTGAFARCAHRGGVCVPGKPVGHDTDALCFRDCGQCTPNAVKCRAGWVICFGAFCRICFATRTGGPHAGPQHVRRSKTK